MLARSAPRTIRQFAVLAWRASPALTVASVVLHLLAAVVTTSAFLLTAEAFTELLATVPTPERLRSALPTLVLVAVAVVGQGLLGAAANAAESVLGPLAEEHAAVELYQGCPSFR
jgi:ATP-binding cassette subfamily B protein